MQRLVGEKKKGVGPFVLTRCQLQRLAGVCQPVSCFPVLYSGRVIICECQSCLCTAKQCPECIRIKPALEIVMGAKLFFLLHLQKPELGNK